MKIAHGLDDLPADRRYPVVTIGNFDGVHVGHRRILTQAAEIARRNSGTSVAMTFWPHPAQFFQPERSLQFLTDRATQRALIEETGIDVALIVPFDREFARVEAKDFVREILIGTLR
ncbi:MAG TPA: adenylyltransferase/cytidyltransferase family protein, partial [Nitrospinota bacterium]|nr:adenylyltransferase/cytidyltransferase family protein [Nitrospinota bacterium]